MTLEEENRELRRQLYRAREAAAKWKRRYLAEKMKNKPNGGKGDECRGVRK